MSDITPAPIPLVNPYVASIGQALATSNGFVATVAAIRTATDSVLLGIASSVVGKALLAWVDKHVTLGVRDRSVRPVPLRIDPWMVTRKTSDNLRSSHVLRGVGSRWGTRRAWRCSRSGSTK